MVYLPEKSVRVVFHTEKETASPNCYTFQFTHQLIGPIRVEEVSTQKRVVEKFTEYLILDPIN